LIEIKRSRKSRQAERWTRGYIESNDPQKNKKHKSIESVQTITTSGVKFVPKMSNVEKARERRIRVRMFRILCSEYFWGRRRARAWRPASPVQASAARLEHGRHGFEAGRGGTSKFCVKAEPARNCRRAFGGPGPSPEKVAPTPRSAPAFLQEDNHSLGQTKAERRKWLLSQFSLPMKNFSEMSHSFYLLHHLETVNCYLTDILLDLGIYDPLC